MPIIKRQLGDRRMGLPAEFPLVDSDDVQVTDDRRLHPDRRKAAITFAEMELLLSQLLRRGPSRR